MNDIRKISPVDRAIACPCFKCQERHEACHDSCPKFIEYHAKCEAYKKERWIEKNQSYWKEKQY